MVSEISVGKSGNVLTEVGFSSISKGLSKNKRLK